MAADGKITIDFDMNIPGVKSDADRINEVLHGIGATAGNKMDESIKSNTSKAKETVSEFKNDMDRKFSKETKVKLVADAQTAGIKNFETILHKLPKKQQTELLAKVQRGEVINYEELLRKIPAKVATQVKLNDNASSGLKSIQRETQQTESRFSRLKDVMLGTFAGGLALSGIHAIVSGLKEATQAGMEYNKEQDTMKTVWTALTTEAPKDGKELINYINSMSQHSIYAADTIDKMAQSFYHVHSSVSETKDWTNAFIRLGSTLHMSNDALAESGEQFAKIVAGGKASAEDMSVMINRFPMFGEALQKATGKSMKQLYAMSAAGKLSATQFTEALDYLSKKYKSGTDEAMTSFQGMSMYISSRWQTLWGDITSTSFKISKKSRQDIRDLLSDDMMKEYAQGISAALGSVFVWISKVLGYVNDHKKTIVDITGNLIELLGIIGKSAWDLFAGAIYNIAKMFRLVDDNGKKTVDPLKQIDKVLQALVDHKEAVQDITKALIAMFAVKKITDFIIYLGRARTALLEFQAVSTLAGSGGGVGGLLSKGAKTATVAGGAESLAGTAGIGSGLVATGTSLISKVAKASPYLAAGTGIVSELTSKNSTGEKAGGSIGTTAGAIAGGMLGSLAGPIGTAVGSAGGAWIGKKLGETIGFKAQEALKGKPITAKVKMKTDTDANAIQKSLAPSMKKLNKALILNMSVDSKSITKTKEQSDKLFKQMSKDVDLYYKNKEKSSAKDLQSLVKQGVMTQKQADADLKKQKKSDENQRKQKQAALAAMQKDTNAYYKQVSKIQNDSTKSESQKEKAIEKAHKKFIKDYVKDEYSMNTASIKNVQKGAKQQQSIYKQLIKDKGKLDTQDFKATQKHANDLYNTSVKSAKKTRDDVVDAADDKYKKTKKTADHEYKDLGSISKSQYEDVVRKAKQQRDDTTSAADDQYKKVTKKATDQHNKVRAEIDKQKDQVIRAANDQATGHYTAAAAEMSNSGSAYSSGFGKIGKIWHGFTKWIGKIFKVFDDSKPFPAEVTNFGSYAKGSSGLPNNQIALVGEEGFEIGRDAQGFHILGAQGPEIRHLSAGTSILPHGQSMALMRKMGIPGYKDGAGDLLGDLSDDMMDVFDMIGKGAGALWSWIKDKTGIDGLLADLTPKGLVKDTGSDSFNLAKDGIIKKLTKLGESSAANPGGSGVARWRPYVQRALAMLGLSGGLVDKVLSQINTESGGNPKAMGGTDGLSDGHAMGLMQVKPGTFKANMVAGHGDIWNGFDNILAGLNYAQHRYGKGLSFLGHGHGYANGGWSFMPAIFGEVPGEPELAINPARDTADEHILQAIQARAAKAPNSATAQLAQVIENAKDSGQVAPIWGQRASQNIKVATGDNSHDYTGHLDNVLNKLDTIANKSLEINGHSFSKTYEAYGSARRVQRTQQARRGLAINVNI